jgi:hypothetical protein
VLAESRVADLDASAETIADATGLPALVEAP